jgi:outer membrane receptor protein involved in Fe transport
MYMKICFTRTPFGAASLVLLALSLSSLATGIALAQSETGTITGTVSDPAGAVVPNAKVTVRNAATNASRLTTTGSSGVYTITNLQPANYTVSVEAPGFSTSQTAVNVTVGGRSGLDIKLTIGQVGTTVEISELAVAVNTETQTLSQVIGSQQIVELPTLSRDPYALVATAGNVSGNTPDGRGVGFAINGQRAASTNVLLDGAANNDEFGAGVGQHVPLDSVQEFSILTNNFTAEFGRATGGIVNVVTKSGTNELHGTAYDFNRLSRLASNSFDSNANGLPRQVFTRNQFGYSLGGAAVKNKLFFFSSTEWTRIRSAANIIGYVPDAALLAQTAPNTQAFFSTYGKLAPGVTQLGVVTKANLPTVNWCSGLAAGNKCSSLGANAPLFDRIAYNVPQDSGGGVPQNTYSTVERVDYNLSDKTQMYFRFALSGEVDQDGSVSNSPYSGFNTPNTQHNSSSVFSLTKSFSSSLVSQTKVDFNRFNNQQPFSSTYGPVPTLYMESSGNVTIPGGSIYLPGYNPLTPGSGIPFGGPQNFLQLYEDVSWVKGRHQFRFGGSYNYLRDNRTFGAYETAGDYLGTSLSKAFENLLQGKLNSFTVAVNPQGKYPCGAAGTVPSCTLALPIGAPNFSRSNRYNDYSLYGQDAWKVTSRLTLNLGLRWEVFGTQHNKNPNLDSNYYLGSGSTLAQQITGGQLQNAPNSPIGKLWVTNMGNFGPRIGIAFDVFGDGKTSLRAGYGIAYERNFGNVTFNIIQNPPNYASVSVTAGVDFPSIPISNDNLGPLAGSSGTKALPKVTLRAVNPNLKTAYAHLISASLEHTFGQRILGAVEYSGSLGENQYGIANYNRPGFGNYYNGTACKPGTDGDPGNCTQRLNPYQYGNINFRTNGGNSIYNAMTVRADIRGDHGVNARLTYTWSHATDDLSDTFSSNVANLGWLDAFNPTLDKGNSFFDIRQRFTVAGTWDFGYTKGSPAMKKLLGGWTLAPIITVSAGSPFSIYDCTNAFTVCPYAFATKNVPVGGDPITATSTPNSYNYLNLDKYFSSAFYDPRTGISDLGKFPSNMVGRNRFVGPGSFNFDLGIYKNIAITERFNLQLRGEGYNFLNHPNLQNPGYQDVSNGGFATTSYAGRRFFQLALKLKF